MYEHLKYKNHTTKKNDFVNTTICQSNVKKNAVHSFLKYKNAKKKKEKNKRDL